MHTYRKVEKGWQVVFDLPGEKGTSVGPVCDFEWEAAAYASFLNGGRYCPDEIEPIFPKEYPPIEDDEPEDHTTPPSKGNFDDYPHEGLQSHRQARK